MGNAAAEPQPGAAGRPQRPGGGAGEGRPPGPGGPGGPGAPAGGEGRGAGPGGPGGPGGLPQGLEAALAGAPPAPVVPPPPAPRPPERPRQEERPEPPRRTESPPPVTPSPTEEYLYPTGIETRPLDLRRQLDRATANVLTPYLTDEVRRMSYGRAAAIPLLGGLVGGILKPFQYGDVTQRAKAAGAFSHITGRGIFEPPVGEVAGGVLNNMGLAGMIVGILSPVASGVRRIMGESAFTQFARFANKREGTGLIGRLMHGMESRFMKGIFLHEDRETTKLLRLYDQKVDLNQWQFHDRREINNLIAAGVVAKMKKRVVDFYNIQLSPKEREKLDRFDNAFDMAGRIFDFKIPTAGQREIFTNDILPDLIRGRERNLWMRQTGAITGAGALKAGALALTGHILAFDNIEKLWLTVEGAAKGALNWGYKVVANVAQPAIVGVGDFAKDVGRHVDYVLKGNLLPALPLKEAIPVPVVPGPTSSGPIIAPPLPPPGTKG